MRFAAILGVSVLFIVLGFGTVTGLYRFEVYGFNLLGMQAEVGFIVTILGLLGLLYLYSFNWVKR